MPRFFHHFAAARRWLVAPQRRAAWVLVIVLLLTALAAANPGWVGPAQAQTVPTVTKSPTAGAPAATATETGQPANATQQAAASDTPAPSATPSATPGPSPTPRPTLPAPRATSIGPTTTPGPGCAAPPRWVPVIAPGRRAELQLRSARFTLWLTQRQISAGANAPFLCWITLTGAASGALPPVPANWTALSRGVRLSSFGSTSQPLALSTRGLQACFRLATRYPAGTEMRVAALGLPAAPTTWMLLPTRRLGNQACAPVTALPATYILVSDLTP